LIERVFYEFYKCGVYEQTLVIEEYI